MATIQTDEFVGEFLEHYGVKGMKWGQRRAERKLEKKTVKADDKWQKRSIKSRKVAAVQKAATKRMKVETKRLNDRPEFSKRSLKKNPALKVKYQDEFSKAFVRVLDEESSRIVGASPSGTRKLRFELQSDGKLRAYIAREDAVKQSDLDDVDSIVIDITLDDLDQFVDINLQEDLMHNEVSEFVDDTLEHYGVKGMKWGKRRSREERRMARVAEEKKIFIKAKPGKAIQVKGGKYREASDDALRAAVGKQIAKKSGVDALTNQELQAVVQRMNLEQQFNKLSKQNQGPGAAFLEKYMKDQGPKLIEDLVGGVAKKK